MRTCLPLFLLCMVPMGPALSALFYTMNRLLSRTETGAWRDYRKAYTDDCGQKYLLAAGHMFLILVFEINIEFFCGTDSCLSSDDPVCHIVCGSPGGDTEPVSAGVPLSDEKQGHCQNVPVTSSDQACVHTGKYSLSGCDPDAV